MPALGQWQRQPSHRPAHAQPATLARQYRWAKPFPQRVSFCPCQPVVMRQGRARGVHRHAAQCRHLRPGWQLRLDAHDGVSIGMQPKRAGCAVQASSGCASHRPQPPNPGAVLAAAVPRSIHIHMPRRRLPCGSRPLGVHAARPGPHAAQRVVAGRLQHPAAPLQGKLLLRVPGEALGAASRPMRGCLVARPA